MDEWAGDFDGGSRECVSRVRVGCGGCRGSRGQGGGGKNEKWGQDRNMVCASHWSPENMMLMIIVGSHAPLHLLDYTGSPRVEGLNNGLETTPVR